ncbi:MAG: GTP-binding protein [Tissierellia bacterium]|nr:GTP-binding protein [Tissierellia bacterium]
MKVVILTGFLGAGKTTFLQSLSNHIDEFVILENDYANADVDRQLLADTEKDIYSLDEGCICCSKKVDFATSVITISNSLDPKYLMVEPTGLGYLSRIIANIEAIKYERIEIMAPIAVVDIHAMDETIADYPELFYDQVRNAGHVLISKTEDSTDDEIKAAADKLRKITKAVVYEKHYNDFSDEEWEALITPFELGGVEMSRDSGVEMEELVFDDVQLPNKEQLLTILKVIVEGRFGKILRGKGTINVGGSPFKVDIVQDRFEVKEHKEELKKLVLIGKNIDRKAMEILFNRG